MNNPHADMGVGLGKVIGLKVEEHRPEDDPGWLAIRLAEALHQVALSQRDASSFQNNVLSERQKALQIQQVIFELEERKRAKAPRRPSRMDPLNTYDLDTCKEELRQIKARNVEFNDKANECLADVKRFQREADRYQKLIREAHAKRKKI
jgi:hypothetical protein